MTPNTCEHDLPLCLSLETWQDKRQPPLWDTAITLKPADCPDSAITRIFKRSSSWSHLSSSRHNNCDMDVQIVSPSMTVNEQCHRFIHSLDKSQGASNPAPPKVPRLMSSALSCAKEKMECGTDTCVLELSKHIDCATSGSQLRENISHTKQRAPPVFSMAPYATRRDAQGDPSRAQQLCECTTEPAVKPRSWWQHPDVFPQSAFQDVHKINLAKLLHKNKGCHTCTDSPRSTSASDNEAAITSHLLSLESASGAPEQLESGSQQWRSSTFTSWADAEVQVQNEFDEQRDVPEGHTMMIRNIPQRLTPKQFHQTLVEIGLGANIQCLYMPQNFSCTSVPLNNGYAFVNLDNAEAVAALEKAWPYNNVFQGRQGFAYGIRVKNIVKARIQGLRENLKHWGKTKTSRIKNRNYRPMLFNAANRLSF